MLQRLFSLSPPLRFGAGHLRPCDARNLGHSALPLNRACRSGSRAGLWPLVAARTRNVDLRPATRRADRLHDRRADAGIDANAEPRDEPSARAGPHGAGQWLTGVHQQLHALTRPEVGASHRERREVDDAKRRPPRVGGAERRRRPGDGQRDRCEKRKAHTLIVPERPRAPPERGPRVRRSSAGVTASRSGR